MNKEPKMEKINQQEMLIQPEMLKTLESITELGIQSKIVIMAVILDIKPASLVETDLIQPAQIIEVEERIKKLFAEFGLVYKQDGIDYQNEPLVSLHYSVAKSSESLEKVRDAQNRMGNINEYHEALGRAVGIPDSAVKGFVSGKKLSQSEIKDKFSKEERAFMFFSPSQEDWESEAEILRNLADKIKQVSPFLYTEALNRIKD